MKINRRNGAIKGLARWALLLGVLVALGASAGCDPFGPDIHGFVVRVDSISAPDVIPPGEALTVRFWGFVGSDNCSRLVRVDQGRGPGVFEITFHGERKVERGTHCTQDPVWLEHEVILAPEFEDPFTIRVRQPDGGTLQRVVRIQ